MTIKCGPPRVSGYDTERGRALNRRVEVAINASEAYKSEMAKR